MRTSYPGLQRKGHPCRAAGVRLLRTHATYYDRVVGVMEELFKFTLLTRDVAQYLVDRHNERKESAQELSNRVNQREI